MQILKIPVRLIAIGLCSMALAACDNNDSDKKTSTPNVSQKPTENLIQIASKASNFKTLVAALQATGLDKTLADGSTQFTVFAPTDEAFAKLGQNTINALLADTDKLSDILLYHVIPKAEIDANAAIASAGKTVAMANGQKVALSLSSKNLLVNLSTVVTTDVEASNGIIHALDTVLIPPAKSAAPTKNIVQTAIDAGSFGTLVTALQAAGLDSVLADTTQTFTVFAPTDAAFGLINSTTLNALIADTPKLTKVLLQHVIIGSAVDSVTAMSLNGKSANTAAEDDVDIKIVDGKLTIQGSTVTVTDIQTTNGVIHVIDKVITETLSK
jgi:uncharacterized surface protein with fasciclin (FAS1) repeats